MDDLATNLGVGTSSYGHSESLWDGDDYEPIYMLPKIQWREDIYVEIAAQEAGEYKEGDGVRAEGARAEPATTDV